MISMGMHYQTYRICKRMIRAPSSAMLAVAIHRGNITNILPLVSFISDISYCLLFLLLNLPAN